MERLLIIVGMFTISLIFALAVTEIYAYFQRRAEATEDAEKLIQELIKQGNTRESAIIKVQQISQRAQKIINQSDMDIAIYARRKQLIAEREINKLIDMEEENE